MSTVDVRAPLLPVTCQLNGRQVTLAARAGSRLLDVLREEGHLLGVKEGCGEGECGACTVLVDGQVACACITLAQTVEGAEVVTVEGLAGRVGKDVHPVQDHFVREMGTQCGFCTPGMVVSAVALLEETVVKEGRIPSNAEINDGISGNLCRCTGYVRIVKAIENAAQEMAADRAHEQAR